MPLPSRLSHTLPALPSPLLMDGLDTGDFDLGTSDLDLAYKRVRDTPPTPTPTPVISKPMLQKPILPYPRYPLRYLPQSPSRMPPAQRGPYRTPMRASQGTHKTETGNAKSKPTHQPQIKQPLTKDVGTRKIIIKIPPRSDGSKVKAIPSSNENEASSRLKPLKALPGGILNEMTTPDTPVKHGTVKATIKIKVQDNEKKKRFKIYVVRLHCRNFVISAHIYADVHFQKLTFHFQNK